MLGSFSRLGCSSSSQYRSSVYTWLEEYIEFKEGFLEVLGKNMELEEGCLKVKLVDGWQELLVE